MPNRKNRYADMDKFTKTRNQQRRRYYSKTAIYEKRDWSEEEKARVLDHSIPDTKLSQELERSVQAIQTMRHKLKKNSIN